MTERKKMYILEWIVYLAGLIIITINVNFWTAMGVYLLGMSCTMAWDRINKR